jgi:hypothetical protein
VLYLDRFEGIAKHSLLKLPICHCETVMLSLMLVPGINQKALQIDTRSFYVKENTPSCRTVTSTNPLIFVDMM